MLLAGRIPLQSVMRQLSEERQVFHSEGDLQHAFGRAIWKLDPRIKVRMEVRHQGAETPGKSSTCSVSRTPGALQSSSSSIRPPGKARTSGARNSTSADSGRMTCCGRGSHKTSSALKGSARNDPRATAWRFWFPTLRRCGANQRGRTSAMHHKGWTLQGNYDLRWDDYAPPVEGLGQFRYLAVEVAPNRLPAG